MKHWYNEQKVKKSNQNRSRNQTPMSLDFSFVPLYPLYWNFSRETIYFQYAKYIYSYKNHSQNLDSHIQPLNCFFFFQFICQERLKTYNNNKIDLKKVLKENFPLF